MGGEFGRLGSTLSLLPRLFVYSDPGRAVVRTDRSLLRRSLNEVANEWDEPTTPRQEIRPEY